MVASFGFNPSLLACHPRSPSCIQDIVLVLLGPQRSLNHSLPLHSVACNYGRAGLRKSISCMRYFQSKYSIIVSLTLRQCYSALFKGRYSPNTHTHRDKPLVDHLLQDSPVGHIDAPTLDRDTPLPRSSLTALQSKTRIPNAAVHLGDMSRSGYCITHSRNEPTPSAERTVHLVQTTSAAGYPGPRHDYCRLRNVGCLDAHLCNQLYISELVIR